MSVDRFRFVSPGVFINEVDQSQIPGQPRLGSGPVIFGVAEKGPAMVPVTVSNYADFVSMFGQPLPGTGRNADVWRTGNRANPTYGAYAAQAWLSNRAPLTFVRLVGDEHPAASAGGKAGWEVPQVTPTSLGGAYGLFIIGTGSAGTAGSGHGEGMLAAVFYLTGSGPGQTVVQLSGTIAGTLESSARAGALIEPVTVGSKREFKVRISGSREVVEKTFNFDPKSSRYIRNVFNTNPQLLNSSITKTSNLKNHILGETYERAVLDFVDKLNGNGDITRSDFTSTYGVILALTSGSAYGGNFRRGYAIPSTPWVIGQQLGSNVAAFDINATVPRLFRVHSRQGVEHSQRSYKISMSDIKQSTNPQFEQYGTFTLLVRDMQDTDENPVILEQFNNLNLNPASNNYIGKRIGDRSYEYDSTNNKWRELGQYPNLSTFIRIEMDEDVENGAQEATLLPFGYRGLPTYRGFNAVSGGQDLKNFALSSVGAGGAVQSIFYEGGSGSLPPRGMNRYLGVKATGSIIFSGSFEKSDGTSRWDEGEADRVAAYRSASLVLTNSAGLVELFVPSSASYRWGRTVTPGTGSVVFFNTGSVPTHATVATSLRDVLNNSTFSRLGLTAKVTSTGGRSIVQLTQSTAGTAGNLRITMSGVLDSGGTLGVSQDGTAWGLTGSFKGYGTGEGIGFLGGAGAASVNDAVFWGSGELIRTASFVMPVLSQRVASSDGNLAKETNAFFGLTTNQAPNTLIFDGTVRDIVRRKTLALAANTVIMSPGFSLDDLTVSSGVATHSGSELGTYFNTILGNSGDVGGGNPYRGTPQGGRRAGTSMTAVSSSYAAILNAGFNRFTMPLYGGLDGVDIFERNPFNNERALAGTSKTAKTAPMYYTILKAIDSVSDPDQIDINMAALPGVTDSQSTDYLLAMAEERKDVLGVIDIPGGYVPTTENTDSFADRKGTSATTVTNVENRNFNSSYGCAYYPWVQINDTASGRRVWVPPSTIAMGVLASSAARSELWFAPAGFNRGGLNNGNAGLNVVNVVEKLTSDQRDNLYEVNINPIASFPAEGIVVFGQKTLQATPSALDRINVRRLLIYLKKQVRLIANNILFDPNIQITWNRFTNRVDPFLSSVQNRFGLSDYRVILDSSTTTPDMVDRNILYAKILLKPTRAIEFIALDFVITRTGVEF